MPEINIRIRAKDEASGALKHISSTSMDLSRNLQDMRKNMDAGLPRLKELEALLRSTPEAKFLSAIQSYADPAAAQLARVQQEYQNIVLAVRAFSGLSEDQKALFNVQAAQQYEKALSGVVGTTQHLARFTRETAAIEAELSGDRDAHWARRKEQLLAELGYSADHANAAQMLAATEERLRVERLQKETGNASTFGKLWEETYKRVDQSMSDWLYGMLSGAESGFKGMKNSFLRMLAEMANAALLRPVTVQVMGVMGGVLGGMFGGAGTAQAGQLAGQLAEQVAGETGGMGGMGNAGLNLPGLSSSFLPESWTRGMSSFLSTPLPGTALPGLMGPTPSGAALSGGLGLGSALGYGALGGLGYSLLGGALGLPQGKYSGITSSLGGTLGAWGGSALATSLAGSGGALAGAAAGSVIPIVGTILGALGGGLLGGLFGGERKTRPSVYTQAINMPISSGFDYTSAFMEGAWYDRAGAEEANKVMPILGEAAKVSAQQIEALVAALPEEFRGKVEAEIQSSVFHAGRGIVGMDKHNWNFQFYDEEQLKQRLEAVVKDIQVAMGRVAQDALADVDLTSMYSFDLSSSEGMDRAVKAVTAVKEITEATRAISEPTSQLVTQAKAAKAQMDAWTASMQEYGVVGEYAKQVVGEYQRASIGDMLRQLEDSVAPLSQYDAAVKAANQSVAEHVDALRILGATEDELARVEGMRAQVLEAMTGAMVTAFAQDLRIRQAQLSGDQNLIASTQQTIQHERELADVRARFGEASVQYQQILHMQVAEQAQLAWQQAQQQAEAAEAAALAEAKARVDALRQEYQAVWQEYQRLYTERLNTMQEELRAAQTLKGTWQRVADSLKSTVTDLWAGSANPDLSSRVSTTQAEFDRLYTLAMGGDAEAAQQIGGVSKELLNLQMQANASKEAYLDAFFGVQDKLKNLTKFSGDTLSRATRQEALLQQQIAVAQAEYKTMQDQYNLVMQQNSLISTVNGSVIGVQNKLNALSKELANALDSYNDRVSDTGGGGSSYEPPRSWQQTVLEDKAADLNSGRWGNMGTGWTAAKVLQFIQSQGYTFERWYAEYGKAEGYASGGITPVNQPFWVGENGPELMMSPQSYGVLRHEDSLELLQQATAASRAGGEAGSGSDMAAELRGIREELSRLRGENQLLRFELVAAVNKGTLVMRRVSDAAESLVEDGVVTHPATEVQQ